MQYDDFLRDGTWIQRRTNSGRTNGAPVLFLDRDGVIVQEVGYLHRVEDIKLIDGAKETIAFARRYGWQIAIVTNQAGIGRGLYTWLDFAAVNSSILGALDEAGAIVDLVIAAPHHAEGIPPYRHINHPMRKPNPGMLLAGSEILGATPSQCVMVGDNASDIRAAAAAGLLVAYLVLTGHGVNFQTESALLKSTTFDVRAIASLNAMELQNYLASVRLG